MTVGIAGKKGESEERKVEVREEREERKKVGRERKWQSE